MTVLRTGLGVVCAAAAAAVGALILGEYEFTGSLPFVAGPLFGLAIGEVMVSVGRNRTMVIAALAGGLAFAGIAWAGWIDANEGIEPVKGLVWVAGGLAAVVATLRTADLGRRQAADDLTADPR